MMRDRLRECILIYPQPSLGNVAQLAAELLASTLALEPLPPATASALVPHDDFIPATSGSAAPSTALLCSPPSAPSSSDSHAASSSSSRSTGTRPRVAILLARTPVIRARRAAHVQSIVRLVRGASESPDARTRAGECTSADGPEARTERDGNESGAAEGTHQALFKSILVLSGADAAMRDDATLSSDMLPIRHLTLDAARGAASASTTSQQEGSLQARLASCAPALDLSLPSTNAKGRSAALAHSGLTLEILHALSLASQGGRDADTSNNHNNGSGRKALDAGALVAFAAEGQNTTLVRALAFATAQAVGLSDSLPRLATPTSQAQERDDDDDEMGDGVQARTEADEIDWREPPTWRVGLMGQDLSTQARADIYG